MPEYIFIWTNKIRDHIADNGISQEDFEHVVLNASNAEEEKSHSSDRTTVAGDLEDGRTIRCYYDIMEDGITVIPTTAVEVKGGDE